MSAAAKPQPIPALTATAEPVSGVTTSPIASLDEAAAIDFAALLTGDQVDELEDGHEERWGMPRRVGLAVLTRSKAELVDGFRGAPDTLVNLVEDVGAYLSHCRAAAELAERAHVRLLVAASAIVAAQISPDAGLG